MNEACLTDIDALATHLRTELKNKKCLLIYAYNGTGKTRLSMAFKNAGRQGDERDTLYFNAFTEDLFTWDNDLEGDNKRVLKLNSASRFFAGLEELEMENRIRPFLHRYADFYFSIDYEQWTISFSREVRNNEDTVTEIIDNIKISRGEENIFIWCFFLAIVQLTIDGAEAYQWVRYIYIDDPVSSLDEHNAIAIACHLAQLLKKDENKFKTIISTHHTLFYNVLCHEFKRANQYFLKKNKVSAEYLLKDTGKTPLFQHVAALVELYQAANSGELYTYHFNVLRSLLEKSASFHGFVNFADCIKQEENDTDGVLHKRLIHIMSHGNYALYQPQEMLEENKAHFRNILNSFLKRYPFNPELFPAETEEAENT